MEYETLSYNFDNLCKGIASLSYDDKAYHKKALDTIKSELNLFFKDFICTEVLLTENTDHDFFGIQVLPMFKSLDTMDILFDPDSNIKFDHYLLEFDSKLFNGDFTARQLAALLIHDINKLNTPSLIKEIIFMMDHISLSKGTNIKKEDILNNKEFFLFTIQDTARKLTSAFEYIPSDLSFADDFIRSYGLNKDYEDGMFGIKACRNNLKDQLCSTSITMNWFIEKHKDLSPECHKDLVNDFRDAVQFAGSKLVRRSINNIINRLVSFRSPGEYRYYRTITEASKKKVSLATQIKQNGLKSLEDDVYEYRMRIKNVDSENEAINIVRQLNNRMGIISDYLENEELTDFERERFYKLYDKYDDLREELSKKAIYNRKMYGLFVDYNALQQMPNSNTIMNTYY